MNDDWTTAMQGLDDVLGQLPRANPDAARTQGVREACHRELARLRFRRPLESALVGGFCAVYVSLLTLIALRSHGLL